jgi:hypothetical protein
MSYGEARLLRRVWTGSFAPPKASRRQRTMSRRLHEDRSYSSRGHKRDQSFRETRSGQLEGRFG